MDEIVEFDASSDNVQHMKEQLKTAGYDVCKSCMTAQYITETVNRLNFGMARLTPRAVTGARHTRRHGERFQVHGFVVCTIDADIATLELVCARPTAKGTGRLLIEMTGERLKSRGIARAMRLFALPEARLRKYYKDMGFREKQVGPPGSNIKLYEMWMDFA